MQYSEVGTNTNLPGNTFSQTQTFEATQRQNNISTHNYSCICEDDEMDHTGIQYRSIFTR